MTPTAVRIPLGAIELQGDLALPPGAPGIVVFAHGSGSSRHSSRNKFVADQLHAANLATLLFDLLTEEEEVEERHTRHLRFDIPMLADRLAGVTQWLGDRRDTHDLAIGYFGASTGGGAALMAAARLPDAVGAVVSRGGRPDLAGPALPHVRAPTLLIVGGDDEPVIGMNRDAMTHMTNNPRLEIIPNATHLFEEPGTLERVADLARDFFTQHLQTADDTQP